MKHKHSDERLFSTGRWILSAEGKKMIAIVEKRRHNRRALSKKKKDS